MIKEAISQEVIDSCKLPPVTKKHAPQSSHEAERQFTQSGRRAAIIEMVANAVRDYPGCTAAELAAKPELKYCSKYPLNTVRSRLSELLDERYPPERRVRHSAGARKCNVHGTMQVTWWAV